ncbi:Clp protease N-terminal domain-containing protein [Nocardioides insulae]|uniref:Clp protease N-terminal domain-containing protein n=1 Tax=Nocardioides insulae TaxID=394734 RepID=UPI00068725BC|nr:Clp protease N-terminal domain-containing protein [Nocardioides insulae]
MTSVPSVTISLEDLVAGIGRAHDDVLDQLADAAILGSHLTAVADDLIGHFVAQARASGASWNDIGASLGVTRQAAQKRFAVRARDEAAREKEPLDPSQGFSRFTPAAQQALMAAHAYAVEGRAAWVTPAHLLLGVMADEALTVRLGALDVDAAAFRDAAEERLPAAVETPPVPVPYDEETQMLLLAGFEQAQRRAAEDVDTVHLLLALAERWPAEGLFAGLPLTRLH